LVSTEDEKFQETYYIFDINSQISQNNLQYLMSINTSNAKTSNIVITQSVIGEHLEASNLMKGILVEFVITNDLTYLVMQIEINHYRIYCINVREISISFVDLNTNSEVIQVISTANNLFIQLAATSSGTPRLLRVLQNQVQSCQLQIHNLQCVRAFNGKVYFVGKSEITVTDEDFNIIISYTKPNWCYNWNIFHQVNNEKVIVSMRNLRGRVTYHYECNENEFESETIHRVQWEGIPIALPCYSDEYSCHISEILNVVQYSTDILLVTYLSESNNGSRIDSRKIKAACFQWNGESSSYAEDEESSLKNEDFMIISENLADIKNVELGSGWLMISYRNCNKQIIDLSTLCKICAKC